MPPASRGAPRGRTTRGSREAAPSDPGPDLPPAGPGTAEAVGRSDEDRGRQLARTRSWPRLCASPIGLARRSERHTPSRQEVVSFGSVRGSGTQVRIAGRNLDCGDEACAARPARSLRPAPDGAAVLGIHLVNLTNVLPVEPTCQRLRGRPPRRSRPARPRRRSAPRRATILRQPSSNWGTRRPRRGRSRSPGAPRDWCRGMVLAFVGQDRPLCRRRLPPRRGGDLRLQVLREVNR